MGDRSVRIYKNKTVKYKDDSESPRMRGNAECLISVIL